MRTETAGRLGNKLSRFHTMMRELERFVLLEELQKNSFNLCETARSLGIHRNTMLLRCRVCDLDVGQLRKNCKSVEAMVEQKIRRSA